MIKILSGKEIAEAIKHEVAEEVKKMPTPPCLHVIRVGDDQASAVYVSNKIKSACEVGIISHHTHLPATITQVDLLEKIRQLNEDESVDGILVQLPLPSHISEEVVLESIHPEKDVDGFNPINAGRLFQGKQTLPPCTPAGVIEMLKRYGIVIEGKKAVVVGRSNIVGKPMAMMLLQENATVTICHSRTTNLQEITNQADILVAAIGKAGFIRSDHIKEGAVVIDVGINKVTDESLARELFDEIIKYAHLNGEPGALFIDRANETNPVPHLYTLEATNPCGEQ
ncbi:MAG: tetrahydrofolate dehydrogenase/cyclohydrolase catalytic domain-containing protein, partial [Pyrinomonadaceae bacterium]